ncbi:hypothetical protein BKH46_03160 [Helicobacter sp. 12S02634-8]|uniref:hypothetical protein n=1 Tax=Helicobacter sp. 12S02634-8 TaxID=1476199 RepID=UPI000BA7B3E5|nr:hypothetical protein [Helicobacter sp. 12S02634-8]PAF47844.1 hypothetical protein BKH46_03160 [Helicobacter sp. 12S02634-8]
MTFREALRAIIKNNGGFAPLKLIYKEIWGLKDKGDIGGKTPENTIRAILQRNDEFFPIGIGVWGLSEYKNELLKAEIKPKTKVEKQERMHAKVQGMLLEMGSQRGFDTYTNDKSWEFDNKKLGSLSTLQEIPLFTYPELIAKNVRYVDVGWFSTDKFAFPVRICEVEHSSDFRAAFTKFKELEFLNAEFYCVAEANRITKFNREIEKKAFESLKNRVKFESYENIIAAYEYEMRKIKF